MTIDLLQREIREVCFRIDTDAMCVWHKECGNWNKCLSVLAQDRDMAGFGRDV